MCWLLITKALRLSFCGSYGDYRRVISWPECYATTDTGMKVLALSFLLSLQYYFCLF